MDSNHYHHPQRETLASTMMYDRRWKKSSSSNHSRSSSSASLSLSSSSHAGGGSSRISRTTLIMGFLSCLAWLYVAGRLWEDAKSRRLLSTLLTLLKINSDQQPKILSVEDKLTDLKCNDVGKRIVEDWIY